MKCQNCGTDNANGARFCEKCGGSLEVVTPAQPASTSSNKKVTFTVADFFKTILDSIIHPMKAFKKLDEGTIADDSIYAGIFLVLTTIVNVLIYIIYFASKKLLKLVKVGDFFKYGFQILGYLVLFIALAAFIYKVASLFIKKDINFKKIIVGILVGFTTAIVAKYILTMFTLFLNDKFFVYVFGIVNIFALLYSLFYTIKIVTKDFGADDEKGTMMNIICLTILFALSTYVLADWFTTLTGWFPAGIFTL